MSIAMAAGNTITGGVKTLTPRSAPLQEEVRFTRLKGLMESSKMYRKMAPSDGKASDFCGAGADEVQTAWKQAFGRSEVICDWDGKYSVIVYIKICTQPTSILGYFDPQFWGFKLLKTWVI